MYCDPWEIVDDEKFLSYQGVDREYYISDDEDTMDGDEVEELREDYLGFLIESDYEKIMSEYDLEY